MFKASFVNIIDNYSLCIQVSLITSINILIELFKEYESLGFPAWAIAVYFFSKTNQDFDRNCDMGAVGG